jgi:hypothetical protein
LQRRPSPKKSIFHPFSYNFLEEAMKNIKRDLTIWMTDSSKVRLVLFILGVSMFVLSAGAPDAMGGIGLK